MPIRRPSHRQNIFECFLSRINQATGLTKSIKLCAYWLLWALIPDIVHRFISFKSAWVALSACDIKLILAMPFLHLLACGDLGKLMSIFFMLRVCKHLLILWVLIKHHVLFGKLNAWLLYFPGSLLFHFFVRYSYLLLCHLNIFCTLLHVLLSTDIKSWDWSLLERCWLLELPLNFFPYFRWQKVKYGSRFLQFFIGPWIV